MHCDEKHQLYLMTPHNFVFCSLNSLHVLLFFPSPLWKKKTIKKYNFGLYHKVMASMKTKSSRTRPTITSSNCKNKIQKNIEIIFLLFVDRDLVYNRKKNNMAILLWLVMDQLSEFRFQLSSLVERKFSIGNFPNFDEFSMGIWST